MAVRVCEVCGEANEPSARFCRVCDAYLGWDSGAATLDGEPLTGTIPTVVESVEAVEPSPVEPLPVEPAPVEPAPVEPETADIAPAREPGPSAPSSSTHPRVAAAARIETPEAVLETTEATVGPALPATVLLRLTNPSSIVDGYEIEPVAPPQWLSFSHGDVHLMPDQELAVPLELGLREGVLVLAQRVALTLRISSQADPERTAEVALQLTVPPLGPSATLEVRPSLIRLEDHAAGEFTVRLDNRAANFPQTVRLSASDAEGVVRFAFAPDVVTVPAGQVVELPVSFSAPEPEAGRELNRQITVEAGNDAGRAAAPLTLVQRTAAEPVDQPVRVRIEPSSLRIERGTTADFDVLLDHRGGQRQVTLNLVGRDPGRAIGFAFSSEQVVLEPGAVAHVRGRLAAAPPPRGGTLQHAFSVIASDGVHDVEAMGSVELTSPPEPILTAAIRVDPPSQLVVNERQAAFQVSVDNRRGVEPLGVRFEGASEDGTARLGFTPHELVIPPGQVGSTRLVVDAPRPEPSESATRRFRVIATDGVRSIEVDAALTQETSNRRPIASRVLVTIGGLLVIIGALAEWFAGFPPFLPSVDLIGAFVRGQLNLADPFLSEPGMRVLVVLFGALMLLGMIGKHGRMTRACAVFIVLLTVAWLIFLAVVAFVPALGLGLVLVWIGCVLGFVGGVLARPRPET
ncbi:hypothetical protein [Agromyces aureus]|uniref:Uncharacterized protein n=1 Tax=Agromyces aureus TaxID=453304 RepID=A0A191WIM9_9MICO|nr:hypothetical protein [Agromyces aureus]ANJ28072.1 hypothetical protein ATC03_16500 [Agromyces aureus]